LLSLILKPLLKNLDKSTEKPEIPFDTEISLSMIESGCLFVSLNETATLIIKSSSDQIRLLNNINGIALSFELIERPEFPSLGMHLEINTVSNNKFNFDYFFNTESPEEIALLNRLRHQDSFDVLLFDCEVVSSKQFELGTNDKLELNKLIDKLTK